MTWPGTRPIHGDRVVVITGKGTMDFVGNIKTVGVRRDGHGFVEPTLPDADPQQHRTLENLTTRFEYWMYSGDKTVYLSPPLRVRGTHRIEDGSLVVVAAP
ncbi:hypothetical protein [Streptomyces sp. GS7]|uniref:hypothetical protein n=1 Tax=Streptomyces sp. GS7 TaxID=2692234 RepID=UPI0013198C15|nr:hypothetical protein [Streptomyces sp. GS7]QHC23457.1 hypothetical protein GR130_20785 [Streptomyces sp. GS7]